MTIFLYNKEFFLPNYEYLNKYKHLKNINVNELYELILRGSYPEYPKLF